ncbi:MAG: response regulator [bacterium]
MNEKKIMVIDAEDSVHERIREAFAELPCSVVSVTDPADAVMQIAVEGPAFILISLDMPGVNPISVLRNVREFAPDVPLIVMSGAFTKEMLIEAKKAKAVDILVKPPDAGRVRHRVSGFFWTHEELDQRAESGPVPADEPERDFVQAVPKGAEVLNVNDAVPGMKIARVVEQGGVVYADKGAVLDDAKIRLLTRMGIAEVCVYSDPSLKKKAAMKQKVPPTPAAAAGRGKEKVFSTVKRTQIRVRVDVPASFTTDDGTGVPLEHRGRVWDISGGGAAILTNHRLAKDSEITLNFKLDDTFEFKDVRAVIRHSTQRGTPEFPFRTGVYFSSVTEKFRENLVGRLFKIQQEQRKKESERRDGRPGRPGRPVR